MSTKSRSQSVSGGQRRGTVLGRLLSVDGARDILRMEAHAGILDCNLALDVKAAGLYGRETLASMRLILATGPAEIRLIRTWRSLTATTDVRIGPPKAFPFAKEPAPACATPRTGSS